MYQFVLGKDVMPPFTLYATHPSLCLSLQTMGGEGIIPYKNALLMVKENEGDYDVLNLDDPVVCSKSLTLGGCARGTVVECVHLLPW